MLWSGMEYTERTKLWLSALITSVSLDTDVVCMSSTKTLNTLFQYYLIAQSYFTRDLIALPSLFT